MTKLEQAARQALGALEVATTPMAKDRQEVLRAITTLREALSGVQALSAAPAEQEEAAQRLRKTLDIDPGDVNDPLHPRYIAGFKSGHAAGRRRAAPAASPTPPAEQQATPKAAPGVGNSGFDHKTAADLLNNKTVSDEAVRKFVATSRWAHDERAALSATLLAMHGVLTSREAEIALLKKALLEAEAAPKAAPGAAPGDAIDEALRERDEADDFINELLDEVLGADRPEWSSAYNRYDAMSDVRERITALHKPAGDKAWGQFQSAMAAPQQEAQEPAVDDPTRRLTVVYRDISPGDEARLLAEHPKASAMSWSHAIRDRDAARAVLAKWGTQPQAGAVPQGWKAVPVNPTPEMWKAAKSVPDPNPPYPPHYGLVWDAMLAASPTPTAEQQARWVERWHGSGGKEFWEGWSILNAANREMIAHLGPDVDPDAVRGIVAAHNEALCGECAGTGGRWCPACAGASPPAEQQAAPKAVLVAQTAPAPGERCASTA